MVGNKTGQKKEPEQEAQTNLKQFEKFDLISLENLDNLSVIKCSCDGQNNCKKVDSCNWILKVLVL